MVGIDRIMSEGRALTNAIGNTVAVMVIAKWQGELNEEHFQKVLHDPEMIDREVEAAMRGEDLETTGRFDRDRTPEAEKVG